MNEDGEQKSSPIDIELLTQIHTQLVQNLQQNTNLRMKYPGEPQKFYQSEEEINNLLEKLTQLSQQHFPIIIQSNVFIPLIKIMNHPNIDLAIEVVSILYELLEQQPQDDKLFQIYFRWAVWLIQNSVVQALVGILVKLDQEKNIEEYQTGLQILKLIEIFTNIHDSVYELLAEDKQLFQYLANRIMPNFVVRHKIIDDNKYVSSDLLIGLLSNSQKSQQIFSQFSGVQVLLQTIASYQTIFPQNPDEKEFLNNLFSCLSILLINHILPQNKKTYHEMKGNYLMINFIRKKNEYSFVALKVMASSLNSLNKQDQTTAVNTIINDGGLKYLFAIFKRKGFRGEDIDEQKIIDQNTLTILYCLIRSSKQVFKDRIEHKLTQNRFQNLQRFFQLRNQYSQNLGKQKNQQTQTKKQSQQQAESRNEYLTKLSEGLSFVEIVDKVILVVIDQYSKLKPKLKNLFQIYQVKYEDIQKTLKDHYQYIGLKNQKLFVENLLASNLVLLKKLINSTDNSLDENKNVKIQN